MIGIVSFLQARAHVADRDRRQIFASNILAIFFCLASLGGAYILYEQYGLISTLPWIYSVAFIFLLVPAVNRWGNDLVGRMALCLLPVVLTMVVTIDVRLHYPGEPVYFDSRLILLAAPVLPGILFRLDEKGPLYFCVGFSAACVLFYDPIHEWVGAGQSRQGLVDSTQYYINYAVIITFTVLVVGVLFLRSLLELAERSLEEQNRQLAENRQEIEAQHEALLEHQEKVLSSSEKLEAANSLITRQQIELENYNAALEKLVVEKSQELLRANEELVKYNNELLQFSYTVSHNLRGPVARLMGLTHLFKVTDDADEKARLEELVIRSSEELDEVLKDLSLIIDVRNEIYRLREKIDLQEEWDRALALLGDNVRREYSISVDFSFAPYIFAVRPMIQSIMYNLLSNAIKYQSPDRPLEISARSERRGSSQTVIEVSDNGLGIDLTTQGKQIFRLYKRFHSHVAGKGLGLYLVKSQVDALGGSISVTSTPGLGTTFTIVFNEPDAVHKQVFHNTDAACVYYDGHRKVTVIEWKRNVTSVEYRQTFGVVFDSLRVYKTPGWISDVTRQGPVSAEDQRWLVDTLASEAIKSGLKQIALVGFDAEEKREYFQTIMSVIQNYNVRIRLCADMQEALSWMEQTLP